MKYVSLICLFFFVYSFFIYPQIISLLSKIRVNKSNKHYHALKIHNFHILLCVYNEEKYIEKKLDSLASIDYPKEKLNITIVSDGSSDSTINIIENHAIFKKINFIKFNERK